MLAVLFTLLLPGAFAQIDQVDFVVRLADGTSEEILEHATAQSVDVGFGIRAELLVFDRPLRPLIRSIQQYHGEVRCGCGLFAQIQALFKHADEKPAVLLTPGGNPAEMIACACKRDLAYLRPEDTFAFTTLQNSTFANKGHWLIPQPDGRYLGLLEHGAVYGTEEEWKRWADRGLLNELFAKADCQEALIPQSSTFVEVEFVRRLYASNALEKWTITPVSQAHVSHMQQRKLRRLIREAADQAYQRMPLRVP